MNSQRSNWIKLAIYCQSNQPLIIVCNTQWIQKWYQFLLRYLTSKMFKPKRYWLCPKGVVLKGLALMWKEPTKSLGFFVGHPYNFFKPFCNITIRYYTNAKIMPPSLYTYINIVLILYEYNPPTTLKNTQIQCTLKKKVTTKPGTPHENQFMGGNHEPQQQTGHLMCILYHRCWRSTSDGLPPRKGRGRACMVLLCLCFLEKTHICLNTSFVWETSSMVKLELWILMSFCLGSLSFRGELSGF